MRSTFNYFPSLITAPLILAVVLLTIQNVHAVEPMYSCKTISGIPTTTAKTSRGSVQIIRWVSNDLGGFTPAGRCEAVSQRFEVYNQTGGLQFITSGLINKQRVLCTAQQNGSSCTGLLFTLKNSDNPRQKLLQLFDLTMDTSKGPLNETNERLYVDMKRLLDTAPVVSAETDK